MLKLEPSLNAGELKRKAAEGQNEVRENITELKEKKKQRGSDLDLRRVTNPARLALLTEMSRLQ